MNFAPQSTTYQTQKVETTEWEDTLVAHGIIEEREELKIQREIEKESRQRAEKVVDEVDKLAGKTLEQLKLVEDDYEEETLRSFREKRIRELKEKAALERFGDVYPIQKADFIKEVSEDSKSCWVVVEMWKDGIRESTKCSELLRYVAKRKKQVKFVRIRSTDCVEGWPDHSVPCLFLYHEGKMQHQIVSLDFCGGAEFATIDSMERALSKYGLFPTDLTGEGDEEITTEQLELARQILEEYAETQEAEDTLSNKTTAAKLPSQKSSKPKTKTTRNGAVLATLDDDDDDDW